MKFPKPPKVLERLLSSVAHRAATNIMNGEFGTLGSVPKIIETVAQSACDIGILKCGVCLTVLVCENSELTCSTCKKSVPLPKIGESTSEGSAPSSPPTSPLDAFLDAFTKKDHLGHDVPPKKNDTKDN